MSRDWYCASMIGDRFLVSTYRSGCLGEGAPVLTIMTSQIESHPSRRSWTPIADRLRAVTITRMRRRWWWAPRKNSSTQILTSILFWMHYMRCSNVIEVSIKPRRHVVGIHKSDLPSCVFRMFRLVHTIIPHAIVCRQAYKYRPMFKTLYTCNIAFLFFSLCILYMHVLRMCWWIKIDILSIPPIWQRQYCEQSDVNVTVSCFKLSVFYFRVNFF